MLSNSLKYSKGQRVSLSKNLTKKGYIDNVSDFYAGYQYYDILWDDGSLEVLAEHEIQEEIKISTSWDLLSNNSLGDFRDFSIANTLYKVKNTTTNTISSLKSSRTIFKAYQYKPLIKFLKSDLKRILIADEVGLGKTIEAGHIMLELAARGNLNNALIICTNSLCDKWKTELQEKFNFTLKKYLNSNELIQDIQNDINAARKTIFGVINYEKCRQEELQNIIAENNYKFDLLICDEAHKIRNSDTAQHKGVAKIVDNSEAVIFLTATPIMTELRNLYNLIRILDKEGYSNYGVFNNAINQNRPFIKALTKLNSNSPLNEIATELNNSLVVSEMSVDDQIYFTQQSTINEIYQNDKLYQRAIKNMIDGENSTENRIKIQQDLVELNSLNHLYSRTRKKDVMNDNEVVKRNPKTITITLTSDETLIYNSVINEYDEHNIGLIQRKRQIASCIITYLTSTEDLKKGNYTTTLTDSKFDGLKSIIREVVINNNKKLIIFAFFTNTLLYLKIKLKELNIETEIIYGAITDRTERIERFQYNENIKILLSSEVGSEGLDFQFCDAIVNYDLPWNPMVIEQRIGRIDRVGQQSPIINIYNLILKDTIEERIYSKLYTRINLFRESLGDLEEILGENEPLGELITKGIESLYKTKLSLIEQNNELERLSRAIENNKQTLENVRSELADAFANDFHFQNEIDLIEKNNRYLTKEEIIKYIENILRIELSSIKLKNEDPNISILELPSNNTSILIDFIEQYKDSSSKNPELENLYRKFKNQYIKSREITITFDQLYAFKHKKIEYISAFHPFINAITNYFSQQKYNQNLAYKIAINTNKISPKFDINSGFYIFTVYKISVLKNSGNGKINTIHYLKSSLADLNKEESIEILDENISDYIYGILQLNCEQLYDDNVKLNTEIVQAIRPSIMMEIKNREKDIRDDEEIKFFSSIKRRTEQELKYINSRINRISEMIINNNGIEAILIKEKKNFLQKQIDLEKINTNARIEVSHSIISINLLKII
ncbi:hypothetical protein DR864_02560 [Runella rosea]|uniref:DEAD/DEAH box helicase n=1 Tax=Runella rosea TaxID=2259595 RepID=A0A344TDG8_9BACT|nr:SNF2-related protein [Runella rosea]AXE16689.1 hypothetical protein DR864_02560 [Runella rosea]